MHRPPTDPHPDQVEGDDDNSAAGEEDPGAALDLPPAPATPEDPRVPVTPPDGPVLRPAG